MSNHHPEAKEVSVEKYVKNVPKETKVMFDELRKLVKATLPEAREVVSYGILGYKIDEKRARVFISGGKDHVAMYPVPKDQTIALKLEPYRKGKGTLWFMNNEPLPKALIIKTIHCLSE